MSVVPTREPTRDHDATAREHATTRDHDATARDHDATARDHARTRDAQTTTAFAGTFPRRPCRALGVSLPR